MTRAPAHTATHADAAPPRRVSHRHDATERQADRAADIVARGGSVTGWSFANVPAEAAVHRDEEEKKKPPEAPVKLEDKPKSQSESYAEGAGKVVEGLLKTKGGQEVQDRITSSKPLTGAIAVGMLAAGKEVPIPLGKGVTLGVKVDGLTEGKVNSAGITLSFGGGTPMKATAKPVMDRDSQKLMESIRAQTGDQEEKAPPLRPLWVPPSVQKLSPPAAAGAGWQSSPFVPGATVPGVQPTPQTPQPDEAKKEDEVKRAPVTVSDAPSAQEYDTSGVDAATRGGGRAIDPALRHSMEARFGYDFSSVRLHDDPQAASAASGVDAAAFTVGEHIVFGTGRFDPSGPEGRRLLAHELAHVVQDRGDATKKTTGAPTRIHRFDFLRWVGMVFGAEGTFADVELRDYLTKITAAGKHEGDFDSDNKARAVVRKFMAGSPGWDLLPAQKRVLVDEMQDGAVYDADENAILDLLRTASWDDLVEIFPDPAERWKSLERDFDGAEHTRLIAFAESTFVGGAASLGRGELRLASPAVPASAPAFAYDPADFEERVRSETITSQELVSRMERFAPAGKKLAIAHVREVAWLEATEAYAVAARLLAEATKDQRPGRQRMLAIADRRMRMLKTVVTHFLRAELPASARALAAGTKAISGAKAVDVKAALQPKPESKVDPDDIEILGPDGQPLPDQKATATKGTDRQDTARNKREAKRKAEEERKTRLGLNGTYGIRIKAKLQELIDGAFARLVTDAGTHVPHTQIVPLAAVAERETNAVVGAYYRTRSDVTPGEKVTRAVERLDVATKDKPGNVHSWFEEYDAQLKSLKEQDDARRGGRGASKLEAEAFHWALYYLRSDEEILGINSAEGATPKFDEKPGGIPGGANLEARTQLAVVRALLADGVGPGGYDAPTTNADKLLATKRAWGGMAGVDDISVDMTDTGDPAVDRMARWRMLQTLIHEYLHILAHDQYDAYAKTFGSDSVSYTTLIEGVDEVFAAMVWSAVSTRTAALRSEVEGPRFASLPTTYVPPAGHYPHIAQAMQLVTSVGLPNVAAAYFLGLVDRIGGPSRPGSPILPKKKPPATPPAGGSK